MVSLGEFIGPLRTSLLFMLMDLVKCHCENEDAFDPAKHFLEPFKPV